MDVKTKLNSKSFNELPLMLQLPDFQSKLILSSVHETITDQKIKIKKNICTSIFVIFFLKQQQKSIFFFFF